MHCGGGKALVGTSTKGLNVAGHNVFLDRGFFIRGDGLSVRWWQIVLGRQRGLSLIFYALHSQCTSEWFFHV